MPALATQENLTPISPRRSMGIGSIAQPEISPVPDEKPRGGKRPGAGRPPTKEPNEFGKWVATSGRAREDVAAELGISLSLLGQLSRGTATPSLRVAVKIEKLTNHQIPCGFWVKDG